MDWTEVERFWFSLSIQEQMYGKDGLDDEIRQRFMKLYEKAKSRHIDSWRHDPDGCTSLIVVLDQFPRNLFRGTKRAYESDDYALELSAFAINQGYLERVGPEKRMFILLPLQHDENLDTNRKCLKLWRRYIGDTHPGVAMTEKHIAILKRFGRYPHRNHVLGRENSCEELKYLQEGDLSAFELSQLDSTSCEKKAALTA